MRVFLCTLESRKPDSVFRLLADRFSFLLLPAHFDSPEYVVVASRSSVAAGGIVTFHPFPIAVRLKGNDRLCDSLVLLFQESFPVAFATEKPAVCLQFGSGYPKATLKDTRQRLRAVPRILLSGLSSLKIN